MLNSPHLLSFLRQHWQIVGVIALASAAALWFAISVLLDFIYFNDPKNQDIALKPWMTPRYIVMSYDLPPEVVAELLDLTPQQDRRVPMRDIAEKMGITLDELTEIVRAAAAAYRAGQQ
ncbi:hypothetical protein [Yoonia sediminilitoris]|uniref:Uncharacterized protein n=1 Tax=Yoonia sediminilitoris TaxID=1286148 RepID=A0A2T6KEP1_9RHOB|nr:hypothetical protein [Yoonia sediminilitoris]PUB13596.1 hypothetical protein C8N45_10755 [Yoonia sediminilitoris]RCW94766.1 hypothetical protein DFP92_10755 [Yoonia sediminilitoris]